RKPSIARRARSTAGKASTGPHPHSIPDHPPATTRDRPGMSLDSKRVTVRILDKEYQVACQPDEKAALLTAAHDLDQRMRQVRNAGGNALGLDRIAVMVALNLCHELQQERGKSPQESLQKLADKLDLALSPSMHSSPAHN